MTVSLGTSQQWKTTHIVQSHKTSCPSSPVIAYGIEDSISRNCRHQLLGKKCQENGTNDGQGQVVHHEEPVQFERFPTFHEFSARKDRQVIRYEHCRRCFEGGERCNTWYKDEVAGGMSDDAGIKLIEMRP